MSSALIVKDLAEQLYNHEHPNPQPYVQNIPRLTEGAASRIFQPQFPTLNGAKIAEIMEEGQKGSPTRKK
jgi:myotubularin-related protein 5/13